MANQSAPSSWLDRPAIANPAKFFSVETLIIVIILLTAIVSRYAMLGERVMSHDEVNHVVPSYDLFQGRAYRHDPVTHGPFQFHILAFSYFLFGDNDTSARIPAATFSIAAVAFVVFAFRRYLGRSGALAAGFLFVISPYMLFYGRYTRNEAFIELIGVVMLFAMLRYLEKGEFWAMILFNISVVMHIIVKETSFIYTAQAMIFLGLMFLLEVRRMLPHKPGVYNRFLLFMLATLLLIFVALGLGISKADKPVSTEALPAAQSAPAAPADTARLAGEVVAVAGALAAGGFGLLLLAREVGWSSLKKIRSFELILLTGTLILPMLSPFPVKMLGFDPIDYATSASIGRTAAFVIVFFVTGVALGWWWNPRAWLINAAVFYAIFTVFYTTFFTNGFGFFTGIVGSLGYWLQQQGVERGSQPLYYYALLQVPVYEYLPALGTIAAFVIGISRRLFFQTPGLTIGAPVPVTHAALATDPVNTMPVADEPVQLSPIETLYAAPRPLPVLALLIFWSITSLVAYSLAGERMPWLTVHITLGMLLAAGWAIGYLIDTIDWGRLTSRGGVLALLLTPVFLAAAGGALVPLLAGPQPFAGNTLDQLQATSRFVVALVAMIAAGGGILYFLRDWQARPIATLLTVAIFSVLTILTARTAYRANYINYDMATEYLVYAHAARGPKDILEQVEEISRRTVGGKDIKVSYLGDALYPYWWYMRSYPNHSWLAGSANPTRELLDNPIIIVGDDMYPKVENLLAANYVKYDYMRLWWPNQDYYNLTWDRIWHAISDPAMRSAVFQIWLNRDYTQYGQLTGKAADFTPENWSPGARIRLYIRRDIVGDIWNYGAAPAIAKPEDIDPYGVKLVDMPVLQTLGGTGTQPGQFDAPRGLAFAADGTLYVADSRNHRIQHLTTDGAVLQTWGTYADLSVGDAPGGTFFEPWGIAVAPDGSVFVTDTWNHRVQKFTADGKFLKMWGYFGQAEQPEAFWGPRGIAVDGKGHVYVMDTGNDRVVVFDGEGTFIAQFGTQGLEVGQMDEPVGIAIDPATGDIFITDTWNRRVQSFSQDATGQFFTPIAAWDFKGWVGQSLDNKPFLALSPDGRLYVTDPEAPRVVVFDRDGNLSMAWGQIGSGADGFGIASAVAVAPDGSVWVSDGRNNMLLRFAPAAQ